MKKEFVFRSRAIIIHKGKLLLVKHVHDTSYACLPGGHMDFGEDPVTCLKRELVEELGVEPKVGGLLYVNTFTVGNIKQPVEFFFLVLNPEDYLRIDEKERTHAHELAEFIWVNPEDETVILPKSFGDDFKSKKIETALTKFIN